MKWLDRKFVLEHEKPQNGRDTMVDRQTSGLPLSDVVERLPQLVNGNPALLRRGKYVTTDIMLEIGPIPLHVAIIAGRIETLSRGPLLMRSWSFAVRGREQTWRRFWAVHPEPRFHDIFALAKFGEFRIEGDFRPLMTNLLYFKGLLESPRVLADER